ncbi:MAG TPA: hypothetical protein VMV99_01565 [Rhodanobacter sp.]|nr:hypothetical protein [Rhodanobacter sp.]
MGIERKLVSLSQFVALLNEYLKNDRDQHSFEEGMMFEDIESGYRFVADMLAETDRQSLDKLVYDKVSVNYIIAK